MSTEKRSREHWTSKPVCYSLSYRGSLGHCATNMSVFVYSQIPTLIIMKCLPTGIIILIHVLWSPTACADARADSLPCHDKMLLRIFSRIPLSLLQQNLSSYHKMFQIISSYNMARKTLIRRMFLDKISQRCHKSASRCLYMPAWCNCSVRPRCLYMPAWCNCSVFAPMSWQCLFLIFW